MIKLHFSTFIERTLNGKRPLLARLPIRQFLTTPLILLPTLFSIPVAQADIAFSNRYEASFQDADWELISTDEHCQLKQQIPRFGHALINRQLGMPLQVELHPKQRIFLKPLCTVITKAAGWKKNDSGSELGNAVTQTTEQAIAEEPVSINVYQGLEKGLYTEFICVDAPGGANETVVALSPVNFLKSLPTYLECVSNIVQKEQKMANDALFAASKLEISFATDSSELTQTADNILYETANFFKEHPEYTSILITGHADSRGYKRNNSRLAAARAKTVKAYFIRQGIPAQQLTIKSFGSSKPADKADNEAAWRRNRRVAIRLIE